MSDKIREMPAPQCQERQILHGRFRADMRVYVEVTRRLESCHAKDFEKIYEVAESARIAFVTAREASNAHTARRMDASDNTVTRSASDRPVRSRYSGSHSVARAPSSFLYERQSIRLKRSGWGASRLSEVER